MKKKLLLPAAVALLAIATVGLPSAAGQVPLGTTSSLPRLAFSLDVLAAVPEPLWDPPSIQPGSSR
jgi:hypothetical protein